jgi:hypothetical protein
MILKQTNSASSQGYFNKVGHLHACEQSKRGGSHQNLIHTVRYHSNDIKIHSFEFTIWVSPKAVFLLFISIKNS